MKVHIYSQQLRSFLLSKVSGDYWPAFLINSYFAAMISMYINEAEPSWDFSIFDGIMVAISVVALFMLLTFLGNRCVTSVLNSFHGKLSDISAFFWGLLIGAAVVIGGNYILFILLYPADFWNLVDFYAWIYMFCAFPCVATTVILAYKAQRVNRAAASEVATNTDDAKKLVQIELHGALWAMQATFVGCIALIVFDAVFDSTPEELRSDYYYLRVFIGSIIPLGAFLSASLPIALPGGYWLGSMIRKADHSDALTEGKAITLGALSGILTITVVFIIAGFLCFPTNDVCFADLDGVADILNLYPYQQYSYIFRWTIAAFAGAVVGKRLFVLSSKQKL